MRREKKNYSVEFKQKAVELTYARGSVSEICRELDIPRSVLGRWRKESKDYGDNGFPGKGNPKLTDEQREVVELKKRLREAELERDILKKAIAIFS
jgi:transposase